MEINFQKKIIKVGDSSAVLIPKGIADMLNKEKEYIFLIREIEDGKTTDSL